MAAHKENLQLLIGAKDKASPILNKVKGAVIGIGAAYLGWQGVKSIIGGIVSAGISSEKVWTDVRASLERHNYAVDKGLKSVQAFSSALQEQTGISDELAGISIQMLLDYNNDLATSFDMVKVAADMAAGAHMDMKSAVDLLGKASVGYTSALSRYGIIIDDSIPKSEKFAEVIKQINQRFGGAAAARMETSAAKLSLLSETVGDFQEQIYRLFAPHLAGAITAATNAFKVFQAVLTTFSFPARTLAEVMSDEVEPSTIDLTAEINNLTRAFKDGRLELDDFRMALDNLGKEEIPTIINMADVYAKEMDRLNKLHREGKLDVFDYMDALRKLEESTTPEIIIRYQEQIIDVINKRTEAQKKAAEESARLAAEEAIRLAEIAIEHAAKVAKNKMMHFEAALARLDEERTKTVAMWRELLDDTEAMALETSDSLFKKLDAGTKKRLQAFENAEYKKQLAAEQTAAELVSVMGNTVNRVVGSMKFLHTESTGVFKNMAADFSQYFVQSALMSLATSFIGTIGGGGILGMLGSLFDTTANDRMAMIQGQHYAEFFISGAMGTFRQANFGQQIARAAIPNYDIDELGVELVKSSRQGFSNLSFQEDFLTENTGYG